MSVELHQIVTFASEVFAGNPAYVLVSDGPIERPTLQRVAQQLREPVLATIFTFGEQLKLSFTTPNGPHPGAGHSAHAAAHIALTRLRPDASRLNLELDNNSLMAIERGSDGPAVTWPIMPYEPIDATERVRASIGIAPVETYIAPFGLLAVLGSSADVASVVPNLEVIAQQPENTLMVTSPDADGGDFAIRVFAPRIGLPEDPVCGTAHRIIVPLWAERMNKTQLISRQLSPRGGRLYCRLGQGTVTIGGAATPFFSGIVGANLA